MMRYSRIFFLQLQRVFEQRSKVFVYFLMSLFTPMIVLLFWQGAKADTSTWAMSSITSYYFLLMIAYALLMAHVEDDVAKDHIQQGELVKYLVRPFSYFWLVFLEEIPYRILQGLLGILILVAFFTIYSTNFIVSTSLIVIVLSILVAILGFFLSFIYKMLLGISAFWLTETGGLFQLSEMLMFIFTGALVPIYFFPKPLEVIAYVLPFGYMIYFPIIAFQGKLQIFELLRVVGVQLLWLGILAFSYQKLWKKGIRRFSGIGQ